MNGIISSPHCISVLLNPAHDVDVFPERLSVYLYPHISGEVYLVADRVTRIVW